MTNSRDNLTIHDHLEFTERDAERMNARNGVVLYVNGGAFKAVDDGGNRGFPLDRTQYVQQDLSAGDAPAPSERGHLAAHDGTGAAPAGLYESEPGNSQWSGIGLAAGNTIGY